MLSALRKNIRDGSNTDFWSLPVAQETRIYVPRLLALATIIAHPEKYPVYFPPVRNAPYLAQVEVGSQIDLKHAAYLAGLSLNRLMQLNPGYNRPATAPTGPSKLVLPIENVEQFTENLARSPIYHPILQRYQVRRGDTLLAVAKRFNSSPLFLKKLNKLASNNLKPGTHLIVPHSATRDPEETATPHETAPTPERYFVAQNKSTHHANSSPIDATPVEVTNSQYQLQPGDTIYMARNGDNIMRIAKHFRITEKSLRSVNQFSKNKTLHPGDKMIIPTHLRLANNTKETVYVVKSGDTIETIAKKFRTTPPAIRVINVLADNDIHEGDNLVIPARA
jgi:membrane-bound lytic murein transglycosylase D